MLHQSHAPLRVSRVLSTIEHVPPSWVKHVSPAYCHHTHIELASALLDCRDYSSSLYTHGIMGWPGSTPSIFWPVWRHILGVPCVFYPTPTGMLGPLAHRCWGRWAKATFWDAPFTPLSLGGVKSRTSQRQEGRHREAGVLSRRLVV